MKQVKMWVVLCVLSVLIVGCGNDGKKKELSNQTGTNSPTTPESTQQTINSPKPEESVEGKMRSRLTNEWVVEEKGNQRPYAIMLNNAQAANPQSGTSQASIIYECLAEGGVTRLMGIFEDFDSEKIGSVRSARHYFVSLADEYDAIFVHYGESKYTDAKIKKLGVDNLSGLTSIGSTVFYRDKQIKAPHNAFASTSGIEEGTSKLKYRTSYRENYSQHYDFYNEDTELASKTTADKVSLRFSKSYSPYFKYNETTKLYERYQFDQPHVDAANDQQLAFKNLIVQFVSTSVMDKQKRLDMELSNASGKGYYISNGKVMDITWKKNEDNEKMSYYDETGNLLTVNTGKTYIALFPDDRVKDVTIK